jgi:ADP-heptose:LPS heptosyltransferase
MQNNFPKRIEKSAKTLLTFFLRFLFKPAGRACPVISNSSAILFLRQDRIGDMVISTGIFRLLKMRFPGLSIGVVASPANVVVLPACAFVDDIFVYGKQPLEILRLIFRIRRKRYDAVVNLVLYSSLTGGLLSALCGPKAYRVRMTEGDSRDFFYHRNLLKKVWGAAARSMLEETAALLGELGVEYSSGDVRPFMQVPRTCRTSAIAWARREPAAFRIGLNLAAGVLDREIPVRTWAFFLPLLFRELPQARGYLFSPAAGLIKRGLAQAGLPPQVSDIPRHANVLEAAAYVLEMDVMVSPDTSLVHICSAVGKPVVGVYKGEENAVLWGPCGVEHERVIAPAGIESVTPEMMMAGLRRLLARAFPGRFTTPL